MAVMAKDASQSIMGEDEMLATRNMDSTSVIDMLVSNTHFNDFGWFGIVLDELIHSLRKIDRNPNGDIIFGYLILVSGITK